MKIAIIGFDVEGRSSFEYFAAQGHQITIRDQKTDIQIPEGAASKLGDSYLDGLEQYDLIVRTAGLNPDEILAKNPNVGSRITTQLNEFFKVCPSQNIIGVTGTKGKGTTSTLIAKILEKSGYKVFLGGNIGIPPLSLLSKVRQADWVVLELSSFQLCDFEYAPRIGVGLMVVPEHLNWHKNMEDYTAAKSRLFALQTEKDTAIYFAKNDTSKQLASSGSGQLIPFYEPPGASVENGAIVMDGQTICKTSELKLLGEHNWQNVCAAVTATWQVEPNAKAARQVLTTFNGLEHRLEFVREVDDIKYYDDSFGTTPETAMVAIRAFAEPKVIILGGSDKGANFDELAATVKQNNVRQAVIIGETGEKIIAALAKAGFSDITLGGEDMESAVKVAQEHVQPGDVVLLSTGCASFGMFEDYKDRGNQFKALVNEL